MSMKFNSGKWIGANESPGNKFRGSDFPENEIR